MDMYNLKQIFFSKPSLWKIINLIQLGMSIKLANQTLNLIMSVTMS